MGCFFLTVLTTFSPHGVGQSVSQSASEPARRVGRQAGKLWDRARERPDARPRYSVEVSFRWSRKRIDRRADRQAAGQTVRRADRPIKATTSIWETGGGEELRPKYRHPFRMTRRSRRDDRRFKKYSLLHAEHWLRNHSERAVPCLTQNFFQRRWTEERSLLRLFHSATLVGFLETVQVAMSWTSILDRRNIWGSTFFLIEIYHITSFVPIAFFRKHCNTLGSIHSKLKVSVELSSGARSKFFFLFARTVLAFENFLFPVILDSSHEWQQKPHFEFVSTVFISSICPERRVEFPTDWSSLIDSCPLAVFVFMTLVLFSSDDCVIFFSRFTLSTLSISFSNPASQTCGSLLPQPVCSVDYDPVTAVGARFVR